MIRAAGDTGASMIRDLAVAIIRDGKATSDWEQSLSVSTRVRGMHWIGATTVVSRLTEQVMKVL